jgi:hypothetical protein
MLLKKILKMLKLFFCKWVSYTTIKPFIILDVTLFMVMSGKSSWVPSRTQGFVLTCCRWADVLWLLYQLPLSCDRWCLGPWQWSFLTSHLMLLLEMIISWHFTSNSVWVCMDLNYLLPLLSIWTRFLITMFKLRCACEANSYVICDGDR